MEWTWALCKCLQWLFCASVAPRQMNKQMVLSSHFCLAKKKKKRREKVLTPFVSCQCQRKDTSSYSIRMSSFSFQLFLCIPFLFFLLFSWLSDGLFLWNKFLASQWSWLLIVWKARGSLKVNSLIDNVFPRGNVGGPLWPVSPERPEDAFRLPRCICVCFLMLLHIRYH